MQYRIQKAFRHRYIYTFSKFPKNSTVGWEMPKISAYIKYIKKIEIAAIEKTKKK